MKENIVGFLTIAGVATFLLAKNPQVIMPLLICGAVILGLLLVAFVIWYGLVQIRIFFRI